MSILLDGMEKKVELVTQGLRGVTAVILREAENAEYMVCTVIDRVGNLAKDVNRIQEKDKKPLRNTRGQMQIKQWENRQSREER